MTATTRNPTAVEAEEQTALGRREMAAARAEVRVSQLLEKAFTQSRMTQRELAETLSVTEGRVSQVLNSSGNLKITTVARYLRAMGYELTIDARPAHPGTPTLQSPPPKRRRAS